MAWTQTDIDALKIAMASGERMVLMRHGETMTQKEFRTVAEMERLLARMEAEVKGSAGGAMFTEYHSGT